MRVLFGIVLGVALTVGAAFIADSWGTDGSTNGSSFNCGRAPQNGQLGRRRRKYAYRSRAHARNLEQDFAQDRQLKSCPIDCKTKRARFRARPHVIIQLT